MLFIYGQDDPWSAGKFDLGHAADSFELVAPGQNHGARIDTLVEADQQIALDALARWTGSSSLRMTSAAHALEVRKAQQDQESEPLVREPRIVGRGN
jgi:hypothetical protein